MRDIIFFIAFRACQGPYFKNNPSYQYENAIGLLFTIACFHVLQLVALLTKGLLIGVDPLKETVIISYIIVAIALYILLRKIFPRKDLPKVLRLYKTSRLGKYARLIAFSYLFINVGLYVIITLFNR